jgi:hypothetical protein
MLGSRQIGTNTNFLVWPNDIVEAPRKIRARRSRYRGRGLAWNAQPAEIELPVDFRANLRTSAGSRHRAGVLERVSNGSTASRTP